MNKREIFAAWAPTEGVWSQWAKPVLFSRMDAVVLSAVGGGTGTLEVGWAVDGNRATALVVDLPGEQGVIAALSLAAVGYRPVPLYNACPEPLGIRALVDVGPIVSALAAAAVPMEGLELALDAPPAFLLDAGRNRALTAPGPGMFDNRSISLPTDFPSGNFLHSRGIGRVVVVQEKWGDPQADLAHTLRRWQEAGIGIFAVGMDQPDEVRAMVVQRPRWFRLAWYNVLATMGFRVNPLGGFGGRLPRPSSG